VELSARGAEAACAGSCCGGAPRRTAGELFERGYRRSRLAPFALEGSAIGGCDGLTARFSLQLQNGLLAEVRFRATTCATLIAYCELLAELATGRSIAGAAAITAPLLAGELPNIPVLKHDRAPLAVAALRSALAHGISVAPREDAA
jgi:hypothetical protein